MKFEIKGKPLKGMSKVAIKPSGKYLSVRWETEVTKTLVEIRTELRIIRALVEARIKGLI